MKALNKVIVILLLLLNINFFSLVNFSLIFYKLNSYTNKMLILMVLIATLFLLLYSYHGSKIKNEFTNEMIFFLLIIFLFVLISLLKYSDNSILRINEYYFYLIIIVGYFYFVTLFKIDYKYVDFIINSCVNISLIYSVLLIIQNYVFSKLLFLNFNEYDLGFLSVNSGSLRISRPSDFIAFSTILLMYRMFTSGNMKNFIVNNLIFLINFFYLVTISRTRMYILIVSLIYFVVIIKSIQVKLLRIFTGFVLIIMLVVAGNQGFFSEVFNFFSGSRVQSYTLRIEELKYYLNILKSSYYVGIGFPDSEKYYNVIHGPFGNYFLSDIGIIGFFTIFGVIGMFFFFLLIRKILRLWSTSHYDSRIFILIIYLSFSLVSLSFFDSQRVLYLPILLSLIEIRSDKDKGDVSHRFN